MKPFVVLLAAAAVMPDLTQLTQMTARFAPVKLKVDQSGLSSGDRQALPKLLEAARLLNLVFMDQMWSGNRALYEKLQKDATPLGRARLQYFWLNKGPWSDLDGHTAFLPDVPARKPLGANFYPEDMTREEFEAWAKTLPEAARREAEGFFTVIRRGANRRLTAVPYSQAYAADLANAAGLLREAAALTENASLRQYLTLRAAAFLSNDYYESDLAWMDLDAPLDITIGPYETYNDEMFGYKAAFEAYITIRDDRETERLKDFSAHLQEVENNLPIEPRHRNPKLGASAPIRVVNEVLASGDGAHGVRTAAFNLPNDERVVHEKGSKRVMLKNIQEAKFESILVPLAARVLPSAAREDLSFDYFFMHILAHELSHGIGPHQIEIAGRSTNPRQELKELYSAIEEAKADITGLYMLQYLFDHGMAHGPQAERQLYTTFLASAFRSLRFGLTDAHAKGMALQFNYLSDKGAFVAGNDGTFHVDFARVKGAVRDLTHDLLTLEAQGDYPGAKRMLDTLGIIRPAVQRALDESKSLPTDIDPVSE
ncbi:MAG: dipeptidyl-peptidase 3 family protein [Bryobacteraceae bacterium]